MSRRVVNSPGTCATNYLPAKKTDTTLHTPNNKRTGYTISLSKVHDHRTRFSLPGKTQIQPSLCDLQLSSPEPPSPIFHNDDDDDAVESPEHESKSKKVSELRWECVGHAASLPPSVKTHTYVDLEPSTQKMTSKPPPATFPMAFLAHVRDTEGGTEEQALHRGGACRLLIRVLVPELQVALSAARRLETTTILMCAVLERIYITATNRCGLRRK